MSLRHVWIRVISTELLEKSAEEDQMTLAIAAGKPKSSGLRTRHALSDPSWHTTVQVRSEGEEMRILLQIPKKRRGQKGFLTVAYGAVDLGEVVSCPSEGPVTLYRVVRRAKKPKKGTNDKETVFSDDDEDDEDVAGWDVAVGKETGNKHDTLGVPLAKVFVRIVSAPLGAEHSADDERFHFMGRDDALIDEQDAQSAAVSKARKAAVLDAVDIHALDADDRDVMVSHLSLAERMQFRLDNREGGRSILGSGDEGSEDDKGPGKFRKWATKLRKPKSMPGGAGPAFDELSGDDADDAPPSRSPPSSRSKAQVALSAVVAVAAAMGRKDDSDSDDTDAVSTGTPGSRKREPRKKVEVDTSLRRSGQRAETPAAGLVAEMDGPGSADDASAESDAEAPAVPEVTSTTAIALTRRKDVQHLWSTSAALRKALPLHATKDSAALLATLSGAIEQRDAEAQEKEDTPPLAVVIVGDDGDVRNVLRPLLDIAAKNRRKWHAVEFWLVPIGKKVELGSAVAAKDSMYRSLFFDREWTTYFSASGVRDAASSRAMADRVLQYATKARGIATVAFAIAEAALTVDKAGSSVQLTVPVLQSVHVGAKETDALPLKLDYWTGDPEEKRELKAFQHVVVERLGAAKDKLSMTAQPKDTKKGRLARKITGKDEGDLVVNVSRVLIAKSAAKDSAKGFVVTVDDVEVSGVKFVSITPRWAGNMRTFEIQSWS